MENLGVDGSIIGRQIIRIGWKGVDWIDLAHDMDESGALKLRLP
jgi:hypothetical protein